MLIAKRFQILVKVCAITATSLKVTFNKAVEDTSKVAFTVTRDGNPVVLTATFADDKKSATLSSSTNLVAGQYTVKIAGSDAAATVDVAAEKVAKIEFTSNVIVKTGADTGTIGYKVYNQYNEDITKSALAANLTWAAVGFDSLTDNNAGVLTVDKTGNFADTDSFVISVIDPASGVTQKGTFTPAAAAALKDLSFGALTLPTGKTRIETNLASAADVAVVAKDQYGNDITTAAALSAATTIVDNDANASASFVDVDGKPYLRLNTTGMTAAKTITVTVLINATGTAVTYNFDVVTAPAASEVALTAPTATIAAGDAIGSVVVPLAVKDQFGADMTADQIAAAATAGAFTITSSNSAVLQSSDLTIATSGVNKGKLVNTGNAVRGAGQTTITVTVNATGKSASFVLDAKAVRAASTIAVPAGITTNLLSGASTSFKYNFVDQYGETFTDLTTDAADLKVNLSVTKVSGDDNGLTVSPAGDVADESTLDATDAVTLTAAAGKTGTYTVTAKLIKISTGETVSQASTNVTVAANNAAGMTYSLEAIPTLYANSAAATGVTGSDWYAAPVKVVAKDANGNTYAIPNSQILNVTTDKGDVLVSSGALGNVTVDKQDNSWVVGADDADNITFATGSNTATDTVRVTLNTADGVQILTKEVTISKEAPKTQELRIVDTDLDAGDHYKLASAAKDVASATFANRAAAATGTAAFVLAKDQYGVWTKKSFEGTSVILNTVGSATPNIDSDNGFEFAGGKFLLDEDVAGTIGYRANTPIKYTIIDGDKTAVFTVTTTAEEAPAVDAVAANKLVVNDVGSDGDLDAGDTITLSFSENLSAASQTAVLNQVKAMFDGSTGSLGNLKGTDTNLNIAFTNAKTLVITVGTAASNISDEITTDIVVSKANVVDTVGNVAAADLNFGKLSDED